MRPAGPQALRVGWLTQRADYLALQKREAPNRYWATPFFVLQTRPITDNENDTLAWRVGLTTSRRVGNAVMRNRARRRLRDLARRTLPELAVPGYDLVLVARTAAAKAPFALLTEHLTIALTKTKMKKEAAC